MLGKGRKVHSRQITDFLEVGGDTGDNALDDQGSLPETESVVTIQAIRKILATEFKWFKEEICRSLNDLEQKIESKLAVFSPKIDIIGAAQKKSACRIEEVQSRETEVESNSVTVNNAIRQLESDMIRLQRTLGDVDNNA